PILMAPVTRPRAPFGLKITPASSTETAFVIVKKKVLVLNSTSTACAPTVQAGPGNALPLFKSILFNYLITTPPQPKTIFPAVFPLLYLYPRTTLCTLTCFCGSLFKYTLDSPTSRSSGLHLNL